MGKIYRLATNDFIFGGGDGYAALARGKEIIDASAGTLMATTVMDHIAEQGEIAPQVEGRITRLN
jgi:2',3'-cyclic-nucleotide 2'-phosphodiesterase (5'-nucleotidase family)